MVCARSFNPRNHGWCARRNRNSGSSIHRPLAKYSCSGHYYFGCCASQPHVLADGLATKASASAAPKEGTLTTQLIRPSKRRD